MDNSGQSNTQAITPTPTGAPAPADMPSTANTDDTSIFCIENLYLFLFKVS